ncbi:MAG: hypothetical protein VB125_00775 [Burkholderia sp.]
MGTYKHLSCEERTLSLEQGARRVRSAANCALTAGVRQNRPRRSARAVRCSLATIVFRSPSSEPITWPARRNS